MIDLGFVIEEEANATIEIWRKSGGGYNDAGRWVGENVDKQTDVLAVVQPATGQKLLDLPEGDRNEARHFLWTTEALATDDIVLYRGKQHRVVFVWDRVSDGGYYRAAIGMTK